MIFFNDRNGPNHACNLVFIFHNYWFHIAREWKRHFPFIFRSDGFTNYQIDWKVAVVEVLVGRGRALNFSRCFSWIICIIGLIAPYICHFKQMTMAKNFERLWKHKKYIVNDEIFIPNLLSKSIYRKHIFFLMSQKSMNIETVILASLRKCDKNMKN